jgi:hypothetical protein
MKEKKARSAKLPIPTILKLLFEFKKYWSMAGILNNPQAILVSVSLYSKSTASRQNQGLFLYKSLLRCSNKVRHFINPKDKY